MYRSKLYFNILIVLIAVFCVSGSMPLQASDYYVSNSGNDSNNGLSPELAWKTIAKVNSSAFSPGDIVLFKRGNEWKETLIPAGSGNSSGYITFGAYGTGHKPIINGADIITAWTLNSTNRWVADCPAIKMYYGLSYSYMAIVDDKMYTQVSTLADVNKPETYFIDTAPAPDKIYIYSPVSPATKRTEVSARMFGIFVNDKKYIKLEDLDFRNTGHTGAIFFASDEGGQMTGNSFVDSCNFYRNRNTGIEFTNGYSGNKVQYCTSTYNGNGFYSLSSHTYGSNSNTFSHCFSGNSIAYTASSGLFTDGHGFGIYDSDDCIVEYCETTGDNYGINIDENKRANSVIFRYNYVHDTQANTPGISVGGDIPAGTVQQAYYNLIVNTGAGEMGIPIWIDGFSRKGEVFVYNNTIYQDGRAEHNGCGIMASTATNVTIKNNIIYSNASKATLMYLGAGSGYVCDNNLYYAPNISSNLYILSGSNYHTLATWKSASGQDAQSVYGNPLFANINTDWTLQSGSPAINAGTTVGLLNDCKGNPVSGIPDLGAFETQLNSNNPLPVYMSSAVENASPSVLTMVYNLTLAAVIPAASAFTVLVNSVARPVNSVAISGTKISLTLSSPVANGNTVTVAYTKPAANPLQTVAGGQAATITAKAVTNNVNPAASPVYVSSSVENAAPSVLTMVYSLNLAAIIPAPSTFTVLVNSVARPVNSVAISGTKISLTLASPVANGNTVTVAYTKPASKPLQTAAGGQAVTITSRPVTNNVNPAASPAYVSSSVENASPSVLTMVYSLNLAAIIPAASAFKVLVNSVAGTVNSVAISGTKISLTLASPLVFGDIVTVAYTKPSNNPIQTAEGGQTATFTAKTVTNKVLNIAPDAVITSPADNSEFSASADITIAANVSDDDGSITLVEFYNGSIRLGSKSAAPYFFTWSDVGAGTYSLTVVATDNFNTKTTSSAVSVTVSDGTPVANQPPVVTILNPPKGNKYATTATIEIGIAASDPDGTISQVELFDGQESLVSLTSAPYIFSLKDAPAGVHTITAIATDNSNASTTSATVEFVVGDVVTYDNTSEIVNLYPNPNNGQFSIEFITPMQNESLEVAVTDLAGKKVYSGPLSADETVKQFDFSYLKSGVYVMIFNDKGIIVTKKFIKR